MALEKVRVGDTGTKIRKTIIEDGIPAIVVSTATSMTLEFTGPGGERTSLTATYDSETGTGDGTDGKIVAVSLVGTWSVSGTWTEEAQITTPSGSWTTHPETRYVEAKAV